jgi:TolB-like protein/tRNA A-37 threonylcarbamoyl transferase component Bud32
MPAIAVMAGQKLGPYLLLEQLGAGGLGEVWKARDARLNRLVALKFISAERRGAARLGELLREARAASALNHPNIITIFEIGEAEGATYLAMEFVSGETLRGRMKRAPVPLDEALDVAAQMAEGLAAAHREGIIHRDLKPENIMLRADGLVKLLDFGLAKVLPWAQAASAASEATASAVTETGQIVGTITYMSPEQARGRPVTPASDVFSFGIILYELLTAEHPFRAESNLDTLTAILTKEPPPVSSRRPGLGAELAAVVERSLRKEPTERFPSVAELSEELRRARSAQVAAASPLPAVRHKPRWMQALGIFLLAVLLVVAGWELRPRATGGAGPGSVRALAVMPLMKEASEPRATEAARALPEDLGAALARSGFDVAAHQSALLLGEVGSARDAGRQLGVDALLEGSVRQVGDRLRVHLELISTRTGFQVWSGNYVLESEEELLSNERAAEIAGDIRKAMAARK